MSDQTPSPDDLDQVLSSLLDGEADDATRARVESEPASMARLEELRIARDLVAEPVVPLDEVTARRLRQTALLSARTTAAPSAGARRRAGFGRWIVSAAAVLLLLVVAVPVLSRLADQGNGDDEASVALNAGDSAESSGPMPESSAGADASADDASGGTTTAAPTDLGVYGTDDALGAAALAAEERGVDRSSAEPDAPDEDAGESAESTVTEDLAQLETLDGTAAACAMNTGSVVVASFSGTVGGEVRLAWVVRDETGGLSVVVVDPATCVVVATRP